MRDVRLLAFDLDGTLVDSKDDIVASVNSALRSAGLVSFPEARIAREIGQGSDHLFRRLLGPAASAELIAELVRRFRHDYGKNLTARTRLYPGIREVLDHYAYLPKVIVTNKSQSLSDRLVGALGLASHFEGVFGMEAFPTRKPDPGPLREVCRRWNLPPHQAAMIGDSEFDMRAGKAAGWMTVGVLYGLGTAEEIGRHRPDYSIRQARDLIPLFDD